MSTQPPAPTSGTDVLRPDEVEPPLADSRYRLVEVLGTGGMATVYRAFDERLQVFRAVKVLSPNLAAHESLRKRFQTEARTMARLRHPNIVGVHDIGVDRDRVFIVMEMVEGGSSWDYLKRYGPLPARMAVEIVLAVLNALSLAHAKGVVHRDIKPHNVLLAADGTAKVADFGIAHVNDSENKGLTKTGSVMGTWGFMAPEQRGGAKHVDARADVYAVGASLYALLTDQMPVDLFVAELDDDLLRAIPSVIKPIIQRSTRYRASSRFESAAAMAADLTEVLSRLPPVPSGQPALGFVPPPPPVIGSSLTMVPDLVAGESRSAPTFADDVFDAPGARQGSDRAEPVDPERRNAPPGFTSVSDFADVDDTAGWTPGKGRLQISLGAGAVLVLCVLAAWVFGVSRGSERAESETTPAALLPRAAEPVPEMEPVPAASKAGAVPPETRSPRPPRKEASREKTTGKASPKPQKVSAETPGEAEALSPAPVVATPAEAPPAEAPPAKVPPKKGVILVTGSHSGVWLVGASGRTYRPGQELGPGSYQVRASFDGGEPVVAGNAVVGAGQKITLHCDEMFWKCQAK